MALSAFLVFFAGDDAGSLAGDAALLVAAGFDFLGEAAAAFAPPLLLLPAGAAGASGVFSRGDVATFLPLWIEKISYIESNRTAMQVEL